MSDDAAAILDLMPARRGHFLLESGYHGGVWLDLDPLFASPRRIAPFVSTLAASLVRHEVSMICGPLLGGAFLAQLLAHELQTGFCFMQRVLPSAPAGLYRARYVLPAAFAAGVRGRRVAIVDDVMSAGSALRGAYAELDAHGAVTAVAGALLVLGRTGADFFAACGIPVEAVARDQYELWTPGACPFCAAGVPLEDAAATDTMIR